MCFQRTCSLQVSKVGCYCRLCFCLHEALGCLHMPVRHRTAERTRASSCSGCCGGAAGHCVLHGRAAPARGQQGAGCVGCAGEGDDRGVQQQGVRAVEGYEGFPQAQTMASFPPAVSDSAFRFDELLSPEERGIRHRTRAFMVRRRARRVPGCASGASALLTAEPVPAAAERERKSSSAAGRWVRPAPSTRPRAPGCRKRRSRR